MQSLHRSDPCSSRISGILVDYDLTEYEPTSMYSVGLEQGLHLSQRDVQSGTDLSIKSSVSLRFQDLQECPS